MHEPAPLAAKGGWAGVPQAHARVGVWGIAHPVVTAAIRTFSWRSRGAGHGNYGRDAAHFCRQELPVLFDAELRKYYAKAAVRGR